MGTKIKEPQFQITFFERLFISLKVKIILGIAFISLMLHIIGIILFLSSFERTENIGMEAQADRIFFINTVNNLNCKFFPDCADNEFFNKRDLTYTETYYRVQWLTWMLGIKFKSKKHEKKEIRKIVLKTRYIKKRL